MGMVGGTRRAIAVAATTCALVGTGVASAAQERTGHRPEPGREPGRGHASEQGSRDAAAARGRAVRRRVQRALPAPQRRRHGHRHRVRHARTSSTRSRTPGYEIGATIEGPAIWRERIADRQAAVRKEKRADARRGGRHVGTQSHQDEIVILRADYFENYAGRFLSVEAKTRDGGAAPTGSTYVGPDAVAVLEHAAPGTPISTHAARDVDQHRPRHHAGHLHRAPRARPHRRARHDLAAAGPTRIRVGSSTRRHQGGRRRRPGSAAACRRWRAAS